MKPQQQQHPHDSARTDVESMPVRALVTQIYAARFAPGDRVRVLEEPADWTGRVGSVTVVYAAGPWPVAVDLDPTTSQPAIRAHLAPDQVTHLHDQPEGAPMDIMNQRQRPRRKSVEEIYRHKDGGNTLYVRVLGGAIEISDFYDDAHYGGTVHDYYYGDGDYGRVEHIPAADLVRVEEIDGKPASEWVFDTYVRSQRPATKH